MTIYSRSDYQAVTAVPGCDQEHLRPIDPKTDDPVALWALTCPGHEAYYGGAGKPKILKYVLDPKTGQTIRQERVPDADPGWSTTPDTVPLTPDEERTRGLKLEKGESQLRALESLLTLKTGGIDLTSRPDVLFYLQQSGLPQETLRMLKGSVICDNGHNSEAGVKFCAECGMSMATRGAIAPSGDEPAAVDLERLHPQTLRKMCRERELPDKGSKEQLVRRLEIAAEMAAA